MKNLELITTAIQSGLIETLSISNDIEIKKTVVLLNAFMELLEESYVLVAWPQSQDYMEFEWFEKEAKLDTSDFPSSSYLIPINRVLEQL